jgi:hypothetical protein
MLTYNIVNLKLVHDKLMSSLIYANSFVFRNAKYLMEEKQLNDSHVIFIVRLVLQI